MAQTKYTRSISQDFGVFPNLTDFKAEIKASDITVEYVGGMAGVGEDGDECEFWFVDPLPSADETIFNGLVTAHQGNVEDPRDRVDIMREIFYGATSQEQAERLIGAIDAMPSFIAMLDQRNWALARARASAGIAAEIITQDDYDLIDSKMPGYVAS